MTKSEATPRRAFVEQQISALQPLGFLTMSAPRSSAGMAVVEVARSEEGDSFRLTAGTLPELDTATATKLRESGLDVNEHRGRAEVTTVAASVDTLERVLNLFGVEPTSPVDLKHGSRREDVERGRRVAALQERIKALLEAALEPGTVELDDEGDFTFPYESTRVFVGVRPLRAGPLLVRVFAITNMAVEASPGLGLFIATTNFTLAFGRFSLDVTNGAVWFEHNLPESFSDDELGVIVRAVALTANEYDERIMEAFGGQLFNAGEPGPVESVPKEPPGRGGYL